MMKKRNTSCLRIVFLACVLIILFLGCKHLDSPPSIESVENHYREHAEDIQTIIHFLSSCDYEDIYITDGAGTMLADLNEIPIGDSDVTDAVGRIMDSSAYYQIVKTTNTIYLLQWTGLRDIGCGIACSINGIDDPEIEFVTQLTPLSEDGWFYYVSDYEQWRSSQ